LKKIYVVRHCEAVGQSAEAHLTDKGYQQALELYKFFSNIKVDRIISSLYRRALESIKPLAENLNMEIEIESNLKERKLSIHSYSDWLEKLEKTYDDLDLKFEGGESSRDAMKRIVQVIENALHSNSENIVIVTHGNLMSLLLKHYIEDFGFEDWQNLSNPDVYLLDNENNKVTIKRIWKE